MITDAVIKELVKAAQDNKIRPEALCALVEVETAGNPFEADNHTLRCSTSGTSPIGKPRRRAS